MRGAILAVVLVVLAACGGSPRYTGQSSSSAASPTVSPGATPIAVFPSPTAAGGHPPEAAVTCTSQIPAGHELALVSLRNTAGVHVRDISDLSHPLSRCIFTNGRGTNFRFVNATHVSYVAEGVNGEGALYMVDLQTQTTSLVGWTNGGPLSWVHAWSPDGNTLSYLSSDGDKVAWHLLSAAGDVTLGDLGPIPARGANPDYDNAMVGFSADGKYVALEHTFGGTAPFQVIRLSDRKVVYSRTNGSMATWAGSGARLYFRTSAGVEAWDASAGAQLVVPGLLWIRPWPSADGLRIAYTAADGTGNHHVGYIRLADQPVAGNQLSFLPRTGAAFLNSTLVWYAEETLCSTPGAGCGLGTAPMSGKTFIRDLVTGTESASIDTAVLDSWPHAGAS